MDAHFSISKMIWFQCSTLDFLNLYPCSTDIQKEAGNKTILMLTVPGYLIITIVFLSAESKAQGEDKLKTTIL
jgi:hypothetical protein